MDSILTPPPPPTFLASSPTVDHNKTYHTDCSIREDQYYKQHIIEEYQVPCMP